MMDPLPLSHSDRIKQERIKNHPSNKKLLQIRRNRLGFAYFSLMIVSFGERAEDSHLRPPVCPLRRPVCRFDRLGGIPAPNRCKTAA